MKILNWFKRKKLTPEEKAILEFKKFQELSRKAAEKNAKIAQETTKRLENHVLKINEKIIQRNTQLNETKERETTKATIKMIRETKKAVTAIQKLI